MGGSLLFIVVHVHCRHSRSGSVGYSMLSSLGYHTQNIPHAMMILLPDESNLHQIREVFESCEEKQQMNS